MADALTAAPTVLFICMANMSRSPMAEALLRHRAAERGIAVNVGSAGFLFEGNPPVDHAVAVLGEMGIDLGRHRSRIVSPELVREATVVLTMERTHARTLAVDVPDAKDRVHTLGSASAALTSMPGPTFAERVAQLGSRRLAVDLLGRGPDEVADPHGGPRRGYRRTVARLDELVGGVLDAMAAA